MPEPPHPPRSLDSDPSPSPHDQPRRPATTRRSRFRNSHTGRSRWFHRHPRRAAWESAWFARRPPRQQGGATRRVLPIASTVNVVPTGLLFKILRIPALKRWAILCHAYGAVVLLRAKEFAEGQPKLRGFETDDCATPVNSPNFANL